MVCVYVNTRPVLSHKLMVLFSQFFINPQQILRTER